MIVRKSQVRKPRPSTPLIASSAAFFFPLGALSAKSLSETYLDPVKVESSSTRSSRNSRTKENTAGFKVVPAFALVLS